MTVTLYANGVMIPKDEVGNFQITNNELVSFLHSIKEKIQKELSTGHGFSPIVVK